MSMSIYSQCFQHSLTTSNPPLQLPPSSIGHHKGLAICETLGWYFYEALTISRLSHFLHGGHGGWKLVGKMQLMMKWFLLFHQSLWILNRTPCVFVSFRIKVSKLPNINLLWKGAITHYLWWWYWGKSSKGTFSGSSAYPCHNNFLWLFFNEKRSGANNIQSANMITLQKDCVPFFPIFFFIQMNLEFFFLVICYK